MKIGDTVVAFLHSHDKYFVGVQNMKITAINGDIFTLLDSEGTVVKVDRCLVFRNLDEANEKMRPDAIVKDES